MKCFKILDYYNICGKQEICLCTEPSKSGAWCICYDEETAQKRIAELHELGFITAYYEEAAEEEQWWNQGHLD